MGSSNDQFIIIIIIINYTLCFDVHETLYNLYEQQESILANKQVSYFFASP